MPTLEIPNLAAIRYQAQTTPPPIAIARTSIPISSQSQSTAPATAPCSCSCQSGLNLCVEQGATLNSQIALKVKDINGVTQPVDITGSQFQFTAKTDPSVPDTDPSVITINWVETVTPKAGTTWLTIGSSVTAAMQPIPYFYQVRMVQSPTSPSPIVTPLFGGTLSVVQPVSPRYK